LFKKMNYNKTYNHIVLLMNVKYTKCWARNNRNFYFQNRLG
jgi:hypothetical protein